MASEEREGLYLPNPYMGKGGIFGRSGAQEFYYGYYGSAEDRDFLVRLEGDPTFREENLAHYVFAFDGKVVGRVPWTLDTASLARQIRELKQRLQAEGMALDNCSCSLVGNMPANIIQKELDPFLGTTPIVLWEKDPNDPNNWR